jgi:glycosyltransferase involved in cell wall biosynthesis
MNFMQLPKISIIVPVYKTEQFLRKCLNSLVNQKFEEIEILLINDGSPDKSQVIIEEYCLLYPDKVKGFLKKNGGLGDARNFGLQYAKGDFIGFIDSDDYIHSEMYFDLYQKANNENADIAICEFAIIDEKDKILNYTDITNHLDISKEDKKFALKYGRNEAFNKIYKKELFLNTAIRYPKIWFEDYPITPLLIEKANRIVYVDRPLYYYVQRKGSIMNQAATFSKRNFEILLATEMIINAKNDFNPEHYWFYLDEVAPIHAFTRFFKIILLIKNVSERDEIIKKWGYELNKILPGWEKSSAIEKLKRKIKNPIKRFFMQIIINSFLTGKTKLLNSILLLNLND